MSEARTPRLTVAGTHSGVGKTTVSLGLAWALRSQRRAVQPFKVGPDYLDPTHLTQLCGRACRSLDGWMLPPEGLRESFRTGCRDADFALIEGVMGLFDGIGGGTEASTAEVARLIDSPVILVIDASSLSASAAAVVAGFRSFDPRVRLAGVVLNRVGSERHEKMLRQAVEGMAKVPVVGAVHRQAIPPLAGRHLGLHGAGEMRPEELLNAARLVADALDLGKLLEIASGQGGEQAAHLPDQRFPGREAGVAARADQPAREVAGSPSEITIGVAKDEAFNFYYPENLEHLEAAGARLRYFSPLRDRELPEGVSGLYLGGGYPELHGQSLAENARMREEVGRVVLAGLPTYAECGGMLYLGQELTDVEGRSYPMAGALPLRAKMGRQRQGLGYVSAEALGDSLLAREGSVLRGHRHHWSHAGAPASSPAYRIRQSGVPPREEGYLGRNLLASYVHVHFGSDPRIAPRFVSACRRWNGGIYE